MATTRRRKHKASKGPAPKPAPGDLAIVQDFVNTAGTEEALDALATPEQLARWLAQRRLLDAGVELDAGQRRQALDLRASLRSLIIDSHTRANAENLLRFPKTLASARFELLYDDEGRPVDFGPASGSFDDALGALVAIAVSARRQGLWPALKLCARDGCHRAFFDTSPSHIGRWCTPRCGYRVRSAAYRRSGKAYTVW